MSNILSIFSTPIYMREIDIPEKSHNFILDTLDLDWPNNNDLHSCRQTNDKFILDTEVCSELKEIIMSNVEIYVREYLNVDKSVKFKMTNSWGVKVTGLTDYADANRHKHALSLISGVFYLKTKDTDSLIRFYNGSPLFNCLMSMPYEKYNEYTSDYWDVPCQDNMLILFPSSLLHTIIKKDPMLNRYSCAFNVLPTGKLTAGFHEMELK